MSDLECKKWYDQNIDQFEYLYVYPYKDYLGRKPYKWLEIYRSSLRLKNSIAYDENDLYTLKAIALELVNLEKFLNLFGHIMHEGKFIKEDNDKRTPLSNCRPFVFFHDKMKPPPSNDTPADYDEYLGM